MHRRHAGHVVVVVVGGNGTPANRGSALLCLSHSNYYYTRGVVKHHLHRMGRNKSLLEKTCQLGVLSSVRKKMSQIQMELKIAQFPPKLPKK